MKNLLKIGFFAFALSLFLTSCGPGDQMKNYPSYKGDSSKKDSIKMDTNVIDSVKVKANSTIKSN